MGYSDDMRDVMRGLGVGGAFAVALVCCSPFSGSDHSAGMHYRYTPAGPTSYQMDNVYFDF